MFYYYNRSGMETRVKKIHSYVLGARIAWSEWNNTPKEKKIYSNYTFVTHLAYYLLY